MQDVRKVRSRTKYTHHCFTAIEALHNLFVRRLSPGEKEVEKEWIDEQVGFRGTWREGWIMYDGTIVMLYKKPGLNGDAYYCTISTLCSGGMTDDATCSFVQMFRSDD